MLVRGVCKETMKNIRSKRWKLSYLVVSQKYSLAENSTQDAVAIERIGHPEKWVLDIMHINELKV